LEGAKDHVGERFQCMMRGTTFQRSKTSVMKKSSVLGGERPELYDTKSPREGVGERDHD